ncbi:MAG: addiction module toxin RelE [Candidatus Micrarchaeota archaeon]
MFTNDMTSELKKVIGKLSKKDIVRVLALNKKIKEIASCNEKTIEHYRNSKYGLSDYKHVHIASSFVLFFRVFKKEKHILFIKLEHHDKAFRR